MASNKAAAAAPPPPLPEPMDFFPFRGQYGGSAAGAALFVAVRAAIPLLFYALLAPPTSDLSIFSSFPSLRPSRPPPAEEGLSIPFFPDTIFRGIEQSLGLPSSCALRSSFWARLCHPLRSSCIIPCRDGRSFRLVDKAGRFK